MSNQDEELARLARSYPGTVAERTTTYAREHEVKLWDGHPWYWVIRRLDDELSKIDPGYNLIQVKQKFGELRFYFQNSELFGSTPVIRVLSDMLVREAERDIAAIEKQRREERDGNEE